MISIYGDFKFFVKKTLIISMLIFFTSNITTNAQDEKQKFKGGKVNMDDDMVVEAVFTNDDLTSYPLFVVKEKLNFEKASMKILKDCQIKKKDIFPYKTINSFQITKYNKKVIDCLTKHPQGSLKLPKESNR